MRIFVRMRATFHTCVPYRLKDPLALLKLIFLDLDVLEECVGGCSFRLTGLKFDSPSGRRLF